jgi:alanyl-tRNA synthetase
LQERRQERRQDVNKLFYEDPYMKEFIAEATYIEEKAGTYHVVLDKTAFFPGGGGQFCDFGTIDNIEVIDVYEKNKIIYHVLKQKLIKTYDLKCSIDWERRQDGMHQHLAQHVLSGCFFKLFNANTVSFHLGHDVSTVDIKGHLDENQIKIALQYANKVIAENIVVQCFVPQESDLTELNLRRALPKTNMEIRVVKIGDLDINACCGVHPKSTQELRMIKINSWEKHKEATRIEFLSGNRAIEASLKNHELLTEICRYLSSNEVDALKCIKNLNQQLKSSLEEKKKANHELACYEVKALLETAENIDNYLVIKHIYENGNVKHVSKLATKLTENDNTIALMAVTNGEKATLIFAASKNIKNISMKDLLKNTIPLIEGSGGGSAYLAQGAGKSNSLTNALDYSATHLASRLSVPPTWQVASLKL